MIFMSHNASFNLGQHGRFIAAVRSCCFHVACVYNRSVTMRISKHALGAMQRKISGCARYQVFIAKKFLHKACHVWQPFSPVMQLQKDLVEDA